MIWWHRWRERRAARRAAKQRAREEFADWIAQECAGNVTLEEADPQLARILRIVGAAGPGVVS
jgi:hypothetical protein